MGSDHHPVRDVLEQVVADSTISPEQVRVLEGFVKADWVIDQDEARILFRVNEALGSNHDDCPAWTNFFVTSVARLVVLDMNTPGVIDESEGDWLAEMLDQYSVDNLSEKKLLLEIQKTTTSIGGKVGERIQSIDHQ